MEIKPKTITLVFVSSLLRKNASLRIKSKDWLSGNQDNMSEWRDVSTWTGCLGIRIICSSRAICLPTYCCFNELELIKHGDIVCLMALNTTFNNISII